MMVSALGLRKKFSPRIYFKYYFCKGESRITFIFSVFNKNIVTKNFVLGSKNQKKKKIKKKQRKNSKKYLLKYATLNYKRILKIVDAEYFKIESSIGAYDAALTAIVTGGIYTLIATGVGIINMYIPLKNTCFKVNPIYNRFYFDFDFKCILKIKIAKTIKELCRFLIWIIKEKMEELKYERTSDMQSYEHSYAKH